MQNRETTIQNEIMATLSEHGCAVFRRHHGVFYTPYGGRITIGVPGEADISGHRPDGIAYYLEVKQPGEHPRQDQQRFLDAMKRSGAIAGVATSPTEALNIVMDGCEITPSELMMIEAGNDQYLNRIDDRFLRTVAQLRFIDHLTWSDVAKRLDYGGDDAIRGVWRRFRGRILKNDHQNY